MRLEANEASRIFIAGVDCAGTAVGRYNEAAPAVHRIRAGDYIVGIMGSEARHLPSVTRIMESAAFELTIQRPRVSTIVMEARGSALGISLQFHPGGTSLAVTHVDDRGSAKACGVDILPGDRIVAVNGVRGASAELLAEVKTSQALELTLSRCG